MRRYLSLVLIIATAFLAIFVASGCGDSGSTNPASLPTSGSTTAKVTFVFNLAQAKTEVPVPVTDFEFTGYDSSEQVVMTPVTVKKDELIGQAQQQSVTLEVPVTAVKVVINYLASDGAKVAKSVKEGLALVGGSEVKVMVSQEAIICETELNVSFALATPLPTAADFFQLFVYDNLNNLVASTKPMAIGLLSSGYTFDEIPLNTSRLIVNYSYGTQLVAASQYQGFSSLQVGQPVNVTIKDFTGEITQVSFDVINTFAPLG